MNQNYLKRVRQEGRGLDGGADDFQAVVDELDPFDPAEELLGHLLLIPGADVPVQHDPAAVGFETEGAAGEIRVRDESVVDPLSERGRESVGGHGESLGSESHAHELRLCTLRVSNSGLRWVKFSGCGLRKKRVTVAIPDGCAEYVAGWRGASQE